MRKSILRNTLCVLLLALCLMVIFAAFILDMRLTSQNTRALVNTASALALSYNAQASPKEQINKMRVAADNMRITIIDDKGVVLADTSADTLNMPNHLQREEIKLARAARTGISVRASETLGKKMLYAAAKTHNGAYVRISVEQSGFLSDMLALLPALLMSALISVVLAGGLAGRFSRSLAKPLLELGESLKAVKDGEVKLIPESYMYPELQDMANDINDISQEISKTLTRLEDEKARIGYILDNMHEGFVMLDDNDTIMLINTAAATAFSCCKISVRGKNLIHATRNIQLLDAVAQVHKTALHDIVSIKLSEERLGEAHISSVQDDGGIILIISDVTERINAAKMRQDFFQSASHELKTPITSIQGFAELLSEGLQESKEKEQEIYERIAKETARMSSLINDIIMISRLESGDISFEAELLDIGAVVLELCGDARQLANQTKIEIKCDVCTAVRTVSRREITELVGNLLQNAIKYNKPNGIINVLLKSENGKLVLSIFNTGEPIPNQYRSRVFERFFRIDKGRSKAAGGTGLGLAIVKHVASRLKANVLLNVQPNGNEFIVEF